MGSHKTLRITVEVIDEMGETVDKRMITEKEIIHPKTASDLGFNQSEQLGILDDVQQSLLDQQSNFLKSTS